MYYVHICIYTCDFHACGWFSYCDELQLRSVQTQRKLDINTDRKRQYGQTKDNLRRVTRMLHGCMPQLLIGQKKERKKVRMHSENYFFASCSKEKKRENKDRERKKKEREKERESVSNVLDSLSKNKHIDSIGNREYLLLSKCIVRF